MRLVIGNLSNCNHASNLGNCNGDSGSYNYNQQNHARIQLLQQTLLDMLGL